MRRGGAVIQLRGEIGIALPPPLARSAPSQLIVGRAQGRSSGIFDVMYWGLSPTSRAAAAPRCQTRLCFPVSRSTAASRGRRSAAPRRRQPARASMHAGGQGVPSGGRLARGRAGPGEATPTHPTATLAQRAQRTSTSARRSRSAAAPQSTPKPPSTSATSRALAHPNHGRVHTAGLSTLTARANRVGGVGCARQARASQRALLLRLLLSPAPSPHPHPTLSAHPTRASGHCRTAA